MLYISPQAQEKLIEEKKKNQLTSEYYVRIDLEEGGCEGMKYAIKFDKTKTENDTIIQEEAINVVINKKNIPYLQNVRLNYSPQHERGFFFDNPNAKNTCGCGQSFSVD